MPSRKAKADTSLAFTAIAARQSPHHQVLSFAATAGDLARFASISRITRDKQGGLSGFQRPQIASHIGEIRSYLEKETAVLPNPIVVAFTDRVKVKRHDKGVCDVIIDCADGPPGFVVDGQQRFMALSQSGNDGFQVFVSALLCKDEAELRRQFVLINNTRPLSKSLIYELLPTVDGLPRRLSDRSLAAEITARLNYADHSSLRGMIHQHTNPEGFISDTAIQRVVMASLSDGIMRDLVVEPEGLRKCFDLISAFYEAVASTFAAEWRGQTPKTSRLVHGAGIVALGEAMETLAALDGARTATEFGRGLKALHGKTAWMAGEWDFGNGDRRHWKAVQNTTRDIDRLRDYLVRIVRDDIRQRSRKRAALER